jgi:AcrR family transcriptional regulator
LIEAAGEAFNTSGFWGTDTNRIARKAGFAPQTFYRHFTDKLDVFLAVYERWREEESAALTDAIKSRPVKGHARAAANILIRHHRDWTMFRRSLRQLALDEPRVRAARAAGRERQLDRLAALSANTRRSKADLVAALLTVERLCDALADGEPQDLGLSDAEWTARIVQSVTAARGE